MAVLVVLSWVIPGLRENWYFSLLGGTAVGLAMVTSAFLFVDERNADRRELRLSRQERRDIPLTEAGEWTPKMWFYAIAFNLFFALSWFLLPYLILS